MRRWKILIGVVVVLAALLVVNAIVLDGQTKSAEVTVEGSQVLELPGGDVQVTDSGPAQPARGKPGPPIVLVHCYSCSLRWWDGILPLLAERHRVIRVDLLGHGGSEKPSGGYSIPEQAALVAGALNQLGIEGATVVGHSMGFSVAVALAEQSSQLTDRLVNIDEGPAEGSCSLPFIAKLAYAPVLGEALWRITPDFAIEDGYSSAFAPGFDIDSGFENPDQIVDDLRAMTFISFDESSAEASDYVEEIPLDDRITSAAIPLLSIFGAEDEICDPDESQPAYELVPGARTVTIDDAGHSPNVEQPEETARLIAEFAAEAKEGAAPRNRP